MDPVIVLSLGDGSWTVCGVEFPALNLTELDAGNLGALSVVTMEPGRRCRTPRLAELRDSEFSSDAEEEEDAVFSKYSSTPPARQVLSLYLLSNYNPFSVLTNLLCET